MNNTGFAYLQIENNRRDEDLDDLSTAGFHSILYDLFSLRSPFGFRDNITNETFDKLSILIWLEEIVSSLEQREQIPISSFTNWPNHLIDTNPFIENLLGEYQQYGKEAAFWIFLIEKAGIVRNINANWVLSKAAKKAKGNRIALLQMLIEGIGFRINWSVLDGKSAKETGQLAFGMSLVLLYKYGEQWRDAMFYTNKYFPIFELAREESKIENHQSEIDFIQVYIYRTFYCFAQMFEFIKIKEEKKPQGITIQIKTTGLFQSLFELRR